MTKQEEIEVGLYVVVNDFTRGLVPPSIRVRLRDKILAYLHENGVVLKVERASMMFPEVNDWLPCNPYKRQPRELGFDLNYSQVQDVAYFFAQQDMLKAGYVAVEELEDIGKRQ